MRKSDKDVILLDSDPRIIGRIRLVASENGVVTGDTGYISNVITIFGLESMLGWLGNPALFDYGTDAFNGTYTTTDHVLRMALGTGTGLAFDDQLLVNELPYNASYYDRTIPTSIRFCQQLAGGTTWSHGASYPSLIDFTSQDKSNYYGVRWSATWASPFVSGPTTLTEVGIYNSTDVDTEDLIAGTSGFSLSVTTATDLQVTYIVAIAQ